MPACLCCPLLSVWFLYSKWNKVNDGFTQSYLQTPGKYITLLFLLQEKRELLCPGLQQHKCPRRCLVGMKCNRKDFCSVIQSRTDLYQLFSVWWLFYLSIWGALSLILCASLLWKESWEEQTGFSWYWAQGGHRARIRHLPWRSRRSFNKVSLWPLIFLWLWGTDVFSKENKERKEEGNEKSISAWDTQCLWVGENEFPSPWFKHKIKCYRARLGRMTSSNLNLSLGN